MKRQMDYRQGSSHFIYMAAVKSDTSTEIGTHTHAYIERHGHIFTWTVTLSGLAEDS